MKNKILILPILIFLSVLLVSCDDSGFVSTAPKGLVYFSQKNLQSLQTNVNGMYELWLTLNIPGNTTNYSLGKFNVTGTGIVDTSGNPMTFRFPGDTNQLNYASISFVTVEPPGDNNPNPSSSVLLSGPVTISNDSLYSSMTLSGTNALGAMGSFLLSGNFYPKYIIYTPTAGGSPCLRGAWLCDTIGNSNFPASAQITSGGWVYEFWLMDKSVPNNPIYYPMGRFQNPWGADNDGAGPCAGPGVGYDKPGQDWIVPNCYGGIKPDVLNINNGNYALLLTLEPTFESPGMTAYEFPFLQLFRQMNISVLCKKVDYLYNLPVPWPSARLKMTY